MKIISRDEIPAINNIEVGGEKHALGIHKDFRRHKDIASFLPDLARLSASWVYLKPEEVLSVHEHPTSSMIIVCEGEGKSLGEIQKNLKAGDIVMVPPNHKHGFVGKGKKGFWGLSFQFEGAGLYEDPIQPRVQFDTGTSQTNKNQNLGTTYNDGKYQNLTQTNDPQTLRQKEFQILEEDQKIYEEKFNDGLLLKLMRSPEIKKDDVKERFLEGLNHWSNWFQKILARRVATGSADIDKYQEMAEEHLEEEVGHNRHILKLRKTRKIKMWDPILEGCCSWFYEKMVSGSQHEKIILIHFVMEAASVIFHIEAVKVFPDTMYFNLHDDLDEDHYEIGVRILREDPTIDIAHLRKTLKQGWEVFDLLTARIAIYAKEGCQKIAV